MLGELFLAGYIGFELARRPRVRKKIMRLFEKSVSVASTYMVNAWSDIKRPVKKRRKK